MLIVESSFSPTGTDLFFADQSGCPPKLQRNLLPCGAHGWLGSLSISQLCMLMARKGGSGGHLAPWCETQWDKGQIKSCSRHLSTAGNFWLKGKVLVVPKIGFGPIGALTWANQRVYLCFHPHSYTWWQIAGGVSSAERKEVLVAAAFLLDLCKVLYSTQQQKMRVLQDWARCGAGGSTLLQEPI